MFELILASSNQHKASEFAELFDSSLVKILPAEDKVDVIEDGDSFHENALKKANAYFERFRVPALADDSGLVVEALPEELGIHSARFGGPKLSDKERSQLLLEKLSNVSELERSAYFICVLCLYINKDETFFFEGRVSGKIGTVATGDKGFGYDPVFYPDGLDGEKSLAEIPEWKATHSHRALACQWVQGFLANYLPK